MKLRYALTLLVLLFAGATNAQNVPNGSFESWTAAEEPTGWVTGNSAPFLITVEPTAMRTDGQFGARGVVRAFNDQAIPPVMITGSIEDESIGYPFTGRPGALKGYMATQLMEGDAVIVTVTLTRNGEHVGSGAVVFNGDRENMTEFNLPIEYTSEVAPDTAIVFITMTNTNAGSPQLGSMFVVDALEFGAATAGIEKPINSTELTISNAAGCKLVSFSSETSLPTRIEVMDVHGRIVETLLDEISNRASIRWSTQGVAAGMYFVRLTQPDGVQIEKIIVGY